MSCAASPPQFAEAQEAAGREAAAETSRRLRSVEARLEALEAEAPGREAAWEAKLRAGGCRQHAEEQPGSPLHGSSKGLDTGRERLRVMADMQLATVANPHQRYRLSCCRAQAELAVPGGSSRRGLLMIALQPLPMRCSDGASRCQAGAGGGGR